MFPVRQFIDHFDQMWKDSPTHFPVFQKEYSAVEKLQREQDYERFQLKVKELQNRKKLQKVRKDPGSSFFPVFKAFLETVFDFEKDHLQVILSDEFKNVSKDFFYKAREFGPELSPENIYQGLRNVWIMNGIQLMMNLPVKITPSVFAYSMIYPYSDNLLDDPSLSSAEKEIFSRRFNRRLHGEEVLPATFTENQLYQLVGMFEEEFPRNEFPEVYESLYAIQQGQTNSLNMHFDNGLTDDKTLDICFEKGGASVLADGYLVAGRLTREQEQALFGYGVYLQLLDDIQDVKEDAEASTKTMYSCVSSDSLGAFVNKTIHFGRRALEEMKCFERAGNDKFIDLMNRSIEAMTIESVGLHPSSYTNDYLDEIEKYSPISFAFVRRKREQSKSQRFAFFQKYFETVKPAEVSSL
ncbi:MAG TPA: hypothetical protein PK335_09050 [Draconibacterium sp.]|nr:hypothetical protein [Draconibacterium sp.]